MELYAHPKYNEESKFYNKYLSQNKLTAWSNWLKAALKGETSQTEVTTLFKQYLLIEFKSQKTIPKTYTIQDEGVSNYGNISLHSST